MTDSSKEPMVSTLSSTTQTAQLPDPSHELAMIIAEAADERKGEDIVLLRVGDVSVLADYFVLVTGFSKVQVRAIARTIEDKIVEKRNRKPLRSEGLAEGTWVLQDYGDVIVHILMPQERQHYDLEAFWGHAPRMSYNAVTAG